MISKEAANAIRKIVLGSRPASKKTIAAAKRLLKRQRMYTDSDNYARQPLYMEPKGLNTAIHRIYRSYYKDNKPVSEHAVTIRPQMVAMNRHADFLDSITDRIVQGKYVNENIADIVHRFVNTRASLKPNTDMLRGRRPGSAIHAGISRIIRPTFDPTIVPTPRPRRTIISPQFGIIQDPQPLWATKKAPSKPYIAMSAHIPQYRYSATTKSTPKFQLPDWVGKLRWDILDTPLSNFTRHSSTGDHYRLDTEFTPGSIREIPQIGLDTPKILRATKHKQYIGDHHISVGSPEAMPNHIIPGHRSSGLMHQLSHLLAEGRMQRNISQFYREGRRRSSLLPYSVDPLQVNRMGVQLGLETQAIQKHIRENPAMFTEFSPRKIQRFLDLKTPSYGRSFVNKNTGVPVNLHKLYNLIRHNPQFYGLYSSEGLRNLNMLDNIASAAFFNRKNDTLKPGRSYGYKPIPDKSDLQRLMSRVGYDIVDYKNNHIDYNDTIGVGLPRKIYSQLLNMW